jgi:hypothetical protein
MSTDQTLVNVIYEHKYRFHVAENEAPVFAHRREAAPAATNRRVYEMQFIAGRE